MMQEARNTLTVVASNTGEQGFGRGLVSIVVGDRFGNLGMIRVTEEVFEDIARLAPVINALGRAIGPETER